MFKTPPAKLRYASLASLCYTLLLLCQLLLPTNAAAASATGYAIVLASAPGKNLEWTTKRSHLFQDRTIYVEQTIIKGSPWERLCLGFFENRKQATSVAKQIQGIYPGAWIQKSSAKSITYTLKAPRPAKTSATKVSPVLPTNSSTLSEKQLDSLMQRARQDIKTEKYSSAVRYLTAVISAGDHKYSQEALELLGQARQRNGQYAHAVDIYEKYLIQYPDSEASDRVRQRLAGLQTASKGPKDEIRMTSEDKNDITSYGTLSQRYRSNIAETDDIGNITNMSQLFTYFNSTTLQRTEKFDHRYQFTADDAYDFIDSDDDNIFRFIETYYELSYRKTGTSGKLGRQQFRIGGLLKRFDGLSAGYQFTPEMRLNFLGGLPVDIDDKSSINKHKTLYGFTFETGTFLEYWDMNLFYFDQTVDGLTDFNSVGTEVRYFDKRTSVFGMIDYDVFYKELNALQLNANVLLDFGTTVYLNSFMRKTPLLATSNALIGQQESTIEELKKVLNIEQIYQLARDRTANSQTLTIGGSQPVSERFQANADITFSQVDETVASGGVLATESTGTNYFFSTQLVGNNLMVKYDTSVLGLRYYSTATSDTISLIANMRFPITRNWRINPRLQFDTRNFTDDRSQQRLLALLRTDYRYLNKVRFDFEIGYDTKETDNMNTGESLANKNLFFMLGYRWDY
jgi:tetratricopeptide (TPR) repeat protein